MRLGQFRRGFCAGLGALALLAMTPVMWGEGLPDKPGKPVLVKVCGACHEPDVVAAEKLSRDEWSDKISHMVELGAKGTEPELYQILDYLTANFGTGPAKVNVNKADAKELAGALEWTTAEAEAVVKYREQNGGFKTLGDLKKVPGLQAAKVDSAKDKLEFN